MATGQASQGGNELVFPCTFDKGTTPTLLDASEAQRVKEFIEAMVLRSKYEVTSGTDVENLFQIIFEGSSVLWRLKVNTALDKWELTGDILLNGYDIVANRAGSNFIQYADEGLVIGSRSGNNGKLRLTDGDSASGAGFKYGGGSTVWDLPSSDASGDAIFLTSDTNAILGWGQIIGGTDITATVSGRDVTIDYTGTGGSLTVEEIDGSPSVSNVTTIKVSNGQLANNGSGVVTITTAQEIYLTATGNGQASGGPVGPHPGYNHFDFIAGDGMELKQATTHADGVEFVVQDSTFTADTGSTPWTPGEGINFVGGNGIHTEWTLASLPRVITTKVDDTVCQSINGISVGDVTANDFSINAGDNVTITGGTSSITIDADKYAIVASKTPGEYVSLACVEAPDVRFEDVIKIAVDERGSFEHELDPEFVHVCEADSIEAISYVCTEPACAGIKVDGGKLIVTFSHVTPLPQFITVKVSGIRAGRAGKRFVRFTEEEARNNAAFWNGWKG